MVRANLTGHIKPDKSAFETVIRSMDWRPGSVLFMDDNQMNVDAARALGIRAFLVSGVQQTRAVLVSNGLLS